MTVVVTLRIFITLRSCDKVERDEHEIGFSPVNNLVIQNVDEEVSLFDMYEYYQLSLEFVNYRSIAIFSISFISFLLAA